MTTPPAAVTLRLGAAFAALLCGVAALLLVADLLRDTPGPTSSATGAPAGPAPLPPATGTPSFPAPPAGAVVLGRQDGDNVLALAARPDGSRTQFQVSVVGQTGLGVGGLKVAVEPVGGGPLPAEACGPGCYRASGPGSPGRVTVLVGEGLAHPMTFELPRSWPPQPAGALVTRAGRVWRGLRSLVAHERLASSPHDAITTVWRYAAPSAFAYDIAGGASGIVIGTRRWDRASPQARWARGEQHPPLPQPFPPWQAVSDAYIVGASRTEWQITFFDPKLSAWFALVVDRATLRTLELHMVTTAHFMHEVYGPFDRPVGLRPPPVVR